MHHRRANKSKKVPNVRLRPAHPDAMARARASPEHTSCWVEDSQIVGSDDTIMLGGSCPRPFKNVVVCATGVLDKPALFKLALELGATSVSAFTDRVTHLVAENHGGAKYQCALERKIPILTPSWIVESHSIWQHGDDVDVEQVRFIARIYLSTTHRRYSPQSIAAHRLPVFTGVTLCISGITDIVRRTQINKLITAGGGTYVKALERPVRVTHLLCSGEDETDKMRYADKFNRAGEADPPIQLVWEEWFWDCLEFGGSCFPFANCACDADAATGRFDEARYQARLPRPERRGASLPHPVFNLTDELLPHTATEAHSPHNANANAKGNPQLPHPRAPPATAYEDDDDGDEFAPVKQRLLDVTLQLWGSLLKARGYEVAGGGVMLSPGKARQMAVQERAAAGDELPEGGSGSVLSSFRRANSYVAPRTTAAAAPRMSREPSSAGAGPSRLPFGRSGSSNDNSAANAAGPSSSRAKRFGEGDAAQAADDVAPAPAPAPNAAPADEPSTVFAGLKFLLRGETDTAPVRGAIEGAGGTVIGERGAELDVDYVIVRLVSGSALYLAEASSVARARYRTECWLERCLFADYLCAPSTHVSFVPLGVSLPVPGADRITLSFSGLDTSEACWVRRLLKALGITLAPAFSRHTTHLLCPGGTGAKYARALAHGAVPDVQAFLVLPGDAAGEAELDVPAEGRKGKGKEKEKAEETMQDITNSYDSQDSQPKQEVFFLPPPPPARPSFGNPGPALGFVPPEGSPGKRGAAPMPSTPSPLKRRQSTGTPSRSRPTTPLALIAHAVPTPTQSSSSSSSARPWAQALARARAQVRRAATFGAASRVTSSSPARVPSSASPSPLRRGVSVSPPKISDERTKALQESITSLLGKLPAVPEDDAPALGRAGKRGRPHRSKPQSRQLSDVLPVPAAGELSTFGGGRSFSPGPDDGAYEGLSIGADEQSMRVMYEDPGQREERLRLAKLMGEPLEGEPLRKRPRRSTRRS
ncbi:hypothetical protein DFH09DRAFT_1370743 [Mycena vulgaris]|nr:hypothetical protein DFH09DRAFT_1370743 [Mycena vulgaris]